jgi:hypothetical protein
MGAYFGYMLALVGPPAREPEVRVDSQSEIACCTSTVIYDDSEDEMPPRHIKKTHK